MNRVGILHEMESPYIYTTILEGRYVIEDFYLT